MNLCKRVTIFEGPDGSGKSTAARQYAEATGARLVHCGPFLRQTAVGLGRTYLEAMLPALLGYQDVVLDRCWLSEPVYGAVFRNGMDRLGVAGRRVLERVAMRCDARVVLCLPPVESCLESWRRRHAAGGEYLERETQLRAVHKLYQMPEGTQLPVRVYDYTRGPGFWERVNGTSSLSTPGFPTMDFHEVGTQSAGHLRAKVLLVGEALTDVTDRNGPDTLYPFGDLSRSGCTLWLTKRLAEAGIREADLLWTNADAPGARALVETYFARTGAGAVALGDKAEAWLQTIDLPAAYHSRWASVMLHPQAWRRFHHSETYPLIKLLQELTQ